MKFITFFTNFIDYNFLGQISLKKRFFFLTTYKYYRSILK